MARILAIHAHPDDVEFLAAGTMALLSDLGHELTIATFTPGDCGSKQMGPEEIAAVRRREAANAAALIGARYICLEMRDLAVFNDDGSRRRVTETLRQARPDLVLTASPSDYHCDHEAASALVRDACFAAPAPNYETPAEAPAPPLDRIPHLYFMDPVEGKERDDRLVEPDCIVDVAPTFGRKRAMLAEHASQRIWLQQHHGMDDYLGAMERWTRERGALVGVDYGEGFRRYRGHAYPQTRLLEELLGAAAVKFGKD
jgi:LmbE family N-acetylglucosaminyl deacetylase